jgi:hypothetical protein
VGAAFIARFMKGTTVYISNPTWGNHRNIFGDEGVEWKYYRWGGACLRHWTGSSSSSAKSVCAGSTAARTAAAAACRE